MRRLTERSGLLARAAIRALLLRPPREDVGPPVLIGSLGGSGSRALVVLLRHAGWAMGEWVGWNTLDSIPLVFYHARWFRELIDYPDVSPRIARRARRELRRSAELHRSGVVGDSGRWGWKQTGSSWFIDLHEDVFPGLRFVHLIRDGRDMAVAKPHGILRRERAFLGLDPDDLITAQLQLWTKNHNRAADTGSRRLGADRYFEVRYEDLCLKPEGAVPALYRFVGAPDSLVDGAVGLLRPSPGIGRWKEHEDEINQRASDEFWAAMRRFGYV